MTLSNIKAQNSFESIQVLTSTAATAVEYFYFANEDSPTGEAGWFYQNSEGDFESADDIKIKDGSSILFASQGTKTIPFSGKVATDKKSVVSVDSGFTMIGNYTPQAVKLKNLACNGINTFDSVQFMDQNLGTAVEYFYFANIDSPTGEAGWFYQNNEGDFESADDKEIDAGAGALFSATAGSVTISFPPAL